MNKPEVDDMIKRAEGLKARIEQDKKELEALKQRIAEAIARFKPGQRVLYRNQDEYEISSVRPGYDFSSVSYYGRKILKAGGLHKNEQSLWESFRGNDLKLVEPKQEVADD